MLLPAAIYARISNRYEEDAASLDSQAAACIAFCAARSIPYDPAYVIREQDSGYETADLRVGLLRLREWVREGRIGAVVVHNTDRLSREPTELVSLWSEFRRAKAEVHFLLAPTEESNIGKAMLFIRGLGHEIEWLAIRERTTRKKASIRASGKRVGEGGPPFGYQWVRDRDGNITADRSLVHDEPAAAAVRLAFSLAASGRLPRDIAAELVSRGFPTPSAYRGFRYADGRIPQWKAVNVRNLLRSEIYKGVCYAGRFTVTDKKIIRRPKKEWVPLPGTSVPPLVDPGVFDVVQKILSGNDLVGGRTRAARAASTRNERDFFAFRGMITCSVCGRPMHAGKAGVWDKKTQGRAKGVYDLLYRCRPLELSTDRCTGKPIYEKHVAEAVWEAVVAVLTDGTLLESELARLKSDRPGEAVLREGLATAERDIKSVDRKVVNLVSSLADADSPAVRSAIKDKLALLDLERAGHDARITRTREALAAYDAIEDRCREVVARAAQIRSGLLDPQKMPWGERRKVMDALRCRLVGSGREVKVVIDLGVSPFADPSKLSRSFIVNDKRDLLAMGFPVGNENAPGSRGRRITGTCD